MGFVACSIDALITLLLIDRFTATWQRFGSVAPQSYFNRPVSQCMMFNAS
jgi:hypothetical protein